MRALLAITGVVLLLAGCTGRATAPAPASKPLLVEARKDAGTFALFLDGVRAPSDQESWSGIMRRHAELVDVEAGFAGFDERGQSENPVILRASPDAPVRLFLEVIEHIVNARIVKLRAELSRPGQDALHCEVEMPRDESLGPDRRHWLIFDESSDTGKPTWKLRMAPRGKAIQAATGDFATTEDWAGKPFRERHEAMLRAAEEVSKDFEYYDATVTWKSSPQPPAWGPVFEALAVIAELNATRRRAGDHATIISTWVSEYAEPPQPEPEDPPSDPNAFPRPAPEDLRD